MWGSHTRPRGSRSHGRSAPVPPGQSPAASAVLLSPLVSEVPCSSASLLPGSWRGWRGHQSVSEVGVEETVTSTPEQWPPLPWYFPKVRRCHGVSMATRASHYPSHLGREGWAQGWESPGRAHLKAGGLGSRGPSSSPRGDAPRGRVMGPGFRCQLCHRQLCDVRPEPPFPQLWVCGRAAAVVRVSEVKYVSALPVPGSPERSKNGSDGGPVVAPR